VPIPYDYYYGPVRVMSIKQLLPQGNLYNRMVDGEVHIDKRKRTLIQLYTDPGGMRTLAAGDIWTKNPQKTDKQW
jgi:hypothetical protein